MSLKNLSDCLPIAETHWRSSAAMMSQARKCIGILSHNGIVTVEALERSRAQAGVGLLHGLSASGLSRKSVACAYGIFRRMLTLNGISTADWPRAPTPERKTREPMKGDDLDRLIGWLDTQGYRETGDLARLLRGTGLRVRVEALSYGALKFSEGAAYGILHVVGKGGHERSIPVVDAAARAVLGDRGRLAATQGLPYQTHLRRWKAATSACVIRSKLPTPHSVRHQYACDALEKSGGMLSMVQELLGHTDPATTARYLAVDLSAKAKALQGGT